MVATPQLRLPSRPSRKRDRPPNVAPFDLTGHLAHTASATDKLDHVTIGLQSAVTTWMMRQGVARTPRVPPALLPRAGQYEQVQDELHAAVRKDKYTWVLLTMPLLGGFKDVFFDFDARLKDFGDWETLEYPAYYLQPFHSLPGGWLNPISASGNRGAMRSLYVRAHRHGVDGIREQIAQLVPRDAKLVYDFGGTGGDQSAAILQRLGPDARAHVIDASPFGLALGSHHNRDPRLTFRLGLLEELDLPEGQADVVNLMFVAHECPDHIKQTLVEKAYHVLKPGGLMLWTDPPSEDLVERSRGFFEPYREQWTQYDPDRALRDAGFREVELHQIVHPRYMWTRVARK